MSSLAKHVIHQPKPFRCTIIVLVTIAFTTSSFWLYQKQTSDQLVSQATLLIDQNKMLLRENQKLNSSNKQQAEKIDSHQHFLAIQQATDEQLKLQLIKLQDELVLLNKELMFYQNITQGSSNSKLQIRELHLSQDITQANKINYRLVITQGKRINKPIKGVVSILLNQDGKQHVINEHSLKLRHVQVFEGQIELTDNMTPNTITVHLKKKKKTVLTHVFDWKIDSN